MQNRSNPRGIASIVAKVAACAALPSLATASIIETDANGGSETNFDSAIVSTDLINQGRASLVSVAATGGPTFPVAGTNDATTTHTSGLTYWGGTHPAGEDVSYTLNTNPGTGGSATGYTLTQVNSFYGWQDSRSRHAAQEWVMSVETVTDPTTFQQVASVVYAPFAPTDGAGGSTKVTLTDTTGALASGVIAIQFHVNTFSSSGNPGYTGELGVIREYDVLGAATPAPEPATTGLLHVTAAGGLMARCGRRFAR
jgi:hypothetical protein